MAKGINIFGTLNGTLGDTVYYRSGGEQKQRIRIRKPANPQTNKQLFQRAKFSAAGMFYTHGRQSFFPYAFEDRKQHESNYNAFMRNNIARAYPVSKSVVDNVAYPVVNNWIVTKGSLPSLNVEIYNPQGTSWYYPTAVINIPSTTEPVVTLAQLSRLLINTGDFEQGDIITFLCILTHIDLPSAGYGYYPEISPSDNAAAHWYIHQFTLNVADTTPLASYGLQAVITDQRTLRLYTFVENTAWTNTEVACGTVIHSRVKGSRTKVSTQELLLSARAEQQLNTYLASNYDTYVEQVIENWRTGAEVVNLRPETTLQGANSINIGFEPAVEAQITIYYTEGQLANGVLKPSNSIVGSNVQANTSLIEFSTYIGEDPFIFDSISLWDEIQRRELTLQAGSSTVIYAGTLSNGSNLLAEYNEVNGAADIRAIQATTSPVATLGGIKITKVVKDGITYTNFTYQDETSGE